MPVYTGVFYRQEGVPESSGSEPCAASTRPLIALSARAQPHERNGSFCLPSTGLPRPSLLLELYAGDFFVASVVRVPTTLVLAWAS